MIPGLTLLDLQNAFGEVNHNLIDTILDYHHIPGDMKLLIRNVYNEFLQQLPQESLRLILFTLVKVFFRGTV